MSLRIIFWALLHCFPDFIVIEFRSDSLRRPYILQDEFWGLTCNVYAIEIGSNCNFQVSQGSVETQGEVETTLYILTKFTQEYDNNRGILQICLYLPKLRLRVKCIGFFATWVMVKCWTVILLYQKRFTIGKTSISAIADKPARRAASRQTAKF